MHVFFSEIPSFEELQDPDSSPRRGEVGRPTLRDSGGFLLSFFYRARFQVFTQSFSGVCREASTTITDKPLDTSGVEESNSPRKVLHVR